MCRLFAVSDTVKVDPGMRQVLMHQLGITSLGDDNQAFGTGITDGSVVYKSGRSAIQVPLVHWIRELDARQTWFGHLRKPSKGVDGAMTAASHPFVFKDSGLVGAHNGFVAGVLPAAPEKDRPFVDSFYGLKKLSDLIVGRSITADIIEEWVANFKPGSEYTFMLKHKGDLWIVKGVRPMYMVGLNGGYVFATSEQALMSTIEYTETFWPNTYSWGKKVEEVFDYTAIHVPAGEKIRRRPIKTRVPDFPDLCAAVRETV